MTDPVSCPLCGHKPHPRPCEHHIGDGCPTSPAPTEAGDEWLRVAFLPADRYRAVATDGGWDVLSNHADGSFS